MIVLKEKTQCCGCTACYNVCPQEAIQMKEDNEGFLYPEIDEEKCVGCSACDSVCPVISPHKALNNDCKSYALRIKDNPDLLAKSTSGGFITPLLEYVINADGVVCAAAYDADFSIKHIIIENKNGGGTELNSIRGSKYVQSSLENCFKHIKRYLEQDRMVCFVGTTCQVEGLKKFLRKEFEKLITVDLVCHGTPSPKLWSKYLSYQKNKYRSEIREISFRNKTYGYHSGTMKICFKNGKTYFGSARVDYMLKSFFSEIASRPICYKCPFKTLHRCSDFTIYDCWSISSLVPDLADDDKGYTNVIVQSDKGLKLLDTIRDRYEIHSVDTDRAIEQDGIMVLNSANPHPKRSEFYLDIDAIALEELIDRFIPISIKDKLIERSKILIYRIGLYRFVKKIMK